MARATVAAAALLLGVGVGSGASGAASSMGSGGAARAAAAAVKPQGGTVELGGLRLKIPPRAEVTERPLPGGKDTQARVIAVTRDDEVLLLTVYHGRRPPKPAKALATHLEEVDRALAKVAVPGTVRGRDQRVRFMGRWARGHALTYRKRVGGVETSWEAVVAAVRRRGVTVVAAWMARRGPERFAPKTVKTAAVY